MTERLTIDGLCGSEECDGFCHACDYMEKLLKKLSHYEDLEEQGRLVVLPEELDTAKFIQIMFKACNCLMWQDKEKCHGSEFKECRETALKGGAE